MCLAIFKPAKAVIPTEHLFNGYENNDNGCGFAYSEKGKLHIVKGLFSFKDFLAQYREHEDCPMIIHFRWATHGNTNVTNCHPFNILNGQFAMIHNGVLPIHLTIKELSDTGNFAKLVMEPMLRNGVHPNKPAFRFLVEQAIGRGNRVALMAANGDVTIYNEDDGEYEDAIDKNNKQLFGTYKKEGKDVKYCAKVWYSNDCYKTLRQRRRVFTRQDEYDGVYDGSPTDDDMTTSMGEGFKGTPLTEFTNRPKLDPPPTGTILGFKGGVKSAEDSAATMQQLMLGNGAPSVHQRTEKNGVIVPLPGIVKKPDVVAHTVTEIEKGPIFSAKEELEIAYLMNQMNLSRGEAITSLQLDIKDAITFIE